MKIIREFLDLTGLSQAALARRCGMDPTVMNSLMTGRRNPGMITIRQLHKATGISIEKLVTSIAEEQEASEAAIPKAAAPDQTAA
jgi:transcriptional regulator with XRE-family HTH domain